LCPEEGRDREDIYFFVVEEKGKSAKRCIILFAPGSLSGPNNQGDTDFFGGIFESWAVAVWQRCKRLVTTYDGSAEDIYLFRAIGKAKAQVLANSIRLGSYT
jgi:hypothetical protein